MDGKIKDNIILAVLGIFVVVLAYTDDYFAQYQVDTFLQAIGYPYP